MSAKGWWTWTATVTIQTHSHAYAYIKTYTYSNEITSTNTNIFALITHRTVSLCVINSNGMEIYLRWCGCVLLFFFSSIYSIQKTIIFCHVFRNIFLLPWDIPFGEYIFNVMLLNIRWEHAFKQTILITENKFGV